MGQNYLYCWKENKVQKWEMIRKKDDATFINELISRKGVDLHSVFIIPVFAILGGIWLDTDTHKSQRVDFWNFFEDYGKKYKLDISNKARAAAQEKEEEHRQKDVESDQKYGFISPDGRFYKCAYRGHYDLAERICFGMVDTSNAEEYLENHGWCKVYQPISRNNEFAVYIGGRHELTDAQMKTLIANGLDKADGVSDMLCKE